jgi:hypothetical protein
MKEAAGGGPEIGATARTLGVRPGIDVPAVNPDDLVRSGQGGMSVSPDDPMNLPHHRRPPEFRGVGRDPLWMIGQMDLGPDLDYYPDPGLPGHGFVEPARSMTLSEYQHALALTQDRWRKVGPQPDEGSTSDAT